MRSLGLAAALGLPAAAVWAQSGAAPASPAAGPTGKPMVVVVGDSLSAEYGIARGTGWVALLEKQLATSHPQAKVFNASVSGDTTAGGRSRLPALLAQHKPDVVVIELGGNDALRGLPLKITEDNLRTMAQAARAAGAKVLLVGMQVPPNYGASYSRSFEALFPAVAQATGAGVVPFLLKGVADGANPTALFQPDRIHPKAEAHPRMLANVWPELKKLLP